MFIHFNKQDVHIQVICGALEAYKPTQDVKAIVDKAAKLKAKLEQMKAEIKKFEDEVLAPGIQEIEGMVKKHNDAHVTEVKA